MRTWLRKRPRFVLHFIPTSSSWLNLIERWFAELEQKAVRRGVFRNVDELQRAIDAFLAAWNDEPVPYTWTASVERILGKIERCRQRLAHLMMVQAHELCRAAHVLPEIKVFYAAFGVGNIVQLAELVAMDQGRLADLRRQMAEIRQREGLTADEDWLYRGGPPDHRALEAEADAIGDGIVDTVLISVLNRYRLHEQAKLYEEDRKQWEYLREVGSRVISGLDNGSDDTEAFTDRYLAKKYGDEFVRDIHHRVSLVREAVARARGHSGQSKAHHGHRVTGL